LLMSSGFNNTYAQLPQFNVQIDEKVQHFGTAYAITQDQQGYIWFSSFTKGLVRYNGKDFKYFRHEPDNTNSPAGNLIISLAVDSSGNIWLGTLGNGIDRYDPVTNKFSHFNYSKSDTNSIASDTVISILVDRKGKIWVGSYLGLDTFNVKTGKFNHVTRMIGSQAVKKQLPVFAVFEDRSGEVWSTYGSVFSDVTDDKGGLFRYNPSTGKQVFYKADSSDPNSLIDPNVFAIFEDSRGTFWVGTQRNGLHTLDRKTGKFTRHLYDSLYPEKLSRPPIPSKGSTDAITFIREDRAGKIWIGTFENGVNWYDPGTKQLYHYGSHVGKTIKSAYNKDTLTGFKEPGAFRFFLSKDSLSWITGMSGSIYLASYGRKTIPYYSNKDAPNSFYLEPNDTILWFGTSEGLVRKNLKTNAQKTWKHDSKNPNSINNNSVVIIQPDETGKLYIGAHSGGMDLFDPGTGNFTHFTKKDSAGPGAKPIDSLHFILIENEEYLWMGGEMGLSRLNRSEGTYETWRYNAEDSNGISGTTVYNIIRDVKKQVWFANAGGVDQFIANSKTFKHYLKGYSVRALLEDAEKKIWAGTDAGMFYYDEKRDQFVPLNHTLLSKGGELILNLLEDDDHNIWITTSNSILKLSADRERIQRFNADYGVLSLNWNWLNNYKARDGRIFIGGTKGYYMFNPEEINVSNSAPLLSFSQLIVEGKEVFPEKNGLLTAAIWNTDEITLAYNQNSFSLDFIAVNYSSTESIKYLYKLENYDNQWRDLGSDHVASFFAVPPGNYTLRIRAVNAEGTTSEKSLNVLITPPWWKTWWAYGLYALLFIIAGWQVYLYQKRYILGKERERSREKELEHAKEIEKAYTELKATQAQLIQSEKMASLGQLTSGIAHEIQNPLNFVNNFSEVSAEMIQEAEQAIGNRQKVIGNSQADEDTDILTILKDVKQNLEKISHHGKRADAIVKSMMLHSRPGSDRKEMTDLNAFTDKYLRLVYHGLRGKDNTLHVDLHTDYDPSIGEIEVIQEDISRVLLNILSNAFYAVHARSKQTEANMEMAGTYLPAVWLSTKKSGNNILITVKDNGNGIPEAIKGKIFQPFFTTKPTGQGTGLGLSLSYDIIKAHGGELRVNSEEGKGAEFVIVMNLNA
jgi:signal transduction histidine kinase/ligand-binding sensor domain-containing protein